MAKGPFQNSRHEVFARAIFEGKSGREAYLSAGYKCTPEAADAAASRLLKNGRVQELLGKLRNKVANKLVLTKAMVIENVHRLAGVAEENDQLSVAKGCWELLAREVGAFTEQKRVTITSLDQAPREEIEAILARLTAGEPAPGVARKAHRGLPN